MLSRKMLRRLGVDDRMIRREVARGRWSNTGQQTIALHTGPIDVLGRRWTAIWEVGDRIAALDGVTALQAAGLTGYEDDLIHVSVKHTATLTPPPPGVICHKVIRRVEGELVTAGIPRVRPAHAAIRAAHWAVSDRQAALVLVMPVQQRLVTGVHLQDAERAIRGRTRRKLIHQLVRDIADGAHSLGELDFVSACRGRGLPEPTRQVVRQGHGGKIYLDVYWAEARLVVEIDGTGHVRGLQQMDDDLRHNAVSMGSDLVLRAGLIGWRLQPEAYVDQVVRAYWDRVPAAA